MLQGGNSSAIQNRDSCGIYATTVGSSATFWVSVSPSAKRGGWTSWFAKISPIQMLFLQRMDSKVIPKTRPSGSSQCNRGDKTGIQKSLYCRWSGWLRDVVWSYETFCKVYLHFLKHLHTYIQQEKNLKVYVPKCDVSALWVCVLFKIFFLFFLLFNSFSFSHKGYD